MKKMLRHLTGIAFLIAILIAVAGFHSCKQNAEAGEETGTYSSSSMQEYPPEVSIFLKIEGSGKDVELKMGPSKEGPFVDATVHTEDVGPGTKVVWRRAANSGIISIKVVSPVPENPRIFPGDATTIILGKRRRIKVDDTGPILLENEKEYSEKYEIEVKMIGGDTPPAFDPYLRIR